MRPGQTIRRSAEALLGLAAAATIGALFGCGLMAILTFATGFLTFASHL